MEERPSTLSLHGRRSSLILRLSQDVPEIIYWGKRISAQTDATMLSLLSAQQQEIAGGARNPVPLSLTPTIGQGYMAHPGLAISTVSPNADSPYADYDAPSAWSLSPKIKRLVRHSETHHTIVCEDDHRQISLLHNINLDTATDVLTICTSIENRSNAAINVAWCAAATLPLPHHISHIMGFEGRWASEFHTHTLHQNSGAYVRENRRGRTSHDCFPGLILHHAHTHEAQGEAYGFHLGWSGNHRLMAEKNADGRPIVQMGELLLPGEIMLSPGASYNSPNLYASYSAAGFTKLSQQFHAHLRENILRPKIVEKPRPVHYNTWEAIYFDHDLDTLKTLANKAADIGVERFVLDDGWFPGRNNDRGGLGDWFVDAEKYPEGLQPLIQHVNDLGMSFGLWFEPEMVNPDSDLFRQHPDWILQTAHNPQTHFRHQTVLDLTRPEVTEYLFDRINSLLTTLNIEYIKWDMNRDLNHPGNALGNPAVHQQTRALYALLEKVRTAHPSVEIESCASGGGRADYGILAHTDRIWTSDNNDALERLKIQKGFSYFFPSELMGSHVGPRDCHITHRTLPMTLRAPVALFGHMGMEMDLRELTAEEETELKAMVSLYKTHRHFIHSGNLYRLDLNEANTSTGPSASIGFGIVSKDQSEALFSYSLLLSTTAAHPTYYRFAGLIPDACYELNIIWPLKGNGHWPKSSLFQLETNLPNIDGKVFTGEALMQLGFQLPVLTPQSNLIFHLSRCK